MHLYPLPKSDIHIPDKVLFSKPRSDHVNLLSLLPDAVLKALKGPNSFQGQNFLL